MKKKYKNPTTFFYKMNFHDDDHNMAISNLFGIRGFVLKETLWSDVLDGPYTKFLIVNKQEFSLLLLEEEYSKNILQIGGAYLAD